MTEPDEQASKRPLSRRFTLIAAGIAAGLAIGLAGVYGIGGFGGNGDPVCRPAVDLARKISPLARGEVAAVTMATRPLKLPNLAFNDSQGKPRTLADWKGRTVLLNLWATWCVPCRKEMPALDALERKLGGPGFEVLAVNIDTRNPDKPHQWLREVGIDKLAYYSDQSAKVFQDLKSIGRAFGMPTTILVDPDGCEIGALAGPAEWASDDAVKLIEAALRK